MGLEVAHDLLNCLLIVPFKAKPLILAGDIEERLEGLEVAVRVDCLPVLVAFGKEAQPLFDPTGKYFLYVLVGKLNVNFEVLINTCEILLLWVYGVEEEVNVEEVLTPQELSHLLSPLLLPPQDKLLQFIEAHFHVLVGEFPVFSRA